MTRLVLALGLWGTPSSASATLRELLQSALGTWADAVVYHPVAAGEAASAVLEVTRPPHEVALAAEAWLRARGEGGWALAVQLASSPAGPLEDFRPRAEAAAGPGLAALGEEARLVANAAGAFLRAAAGETGAAETLAVVALARRRQELARSR